MVTKIVSEDDAFRTFAVDPPHAAHTIRQRILRRVVELGTQVADGSARDWGDYQRRIGEITGLQEAVRICEEMEKVDRR